MMFTPESERQILHTAHQALERATQRRRRTLKAVCALAPVLGVGLAAVLRAALFDQPWPVPSPTPPSPPATGPVATADSATGRFTAPWLEVIESDEELEDELMAAGHCAHVVRSGARVRLVDCSSLGSHAAPNRAEDDETSSRAPF